MGDAHLQMSTYKVAFVRPCRKSCTDSSLWLTGRHESCDSSKATKALLREGGGEHYMHGGVGPAGSGGPEGVQCLVCSYVSKPLGLHACSPLLLKQTQSALCHPSRPAMSDLEELLELGGDPPPCAGTSFQQSLIKTDHTHFQIITYLRLIINLSDAAPLRIRTPTVGAAYLRVQSNDARTKYTKFPILFTMSSIHNFQNVSFFHSSRM